MHMALIFLVPGLFIVMGWLWRHDHYPRSRNAVFGYRTALSMQSDEAWKYAQAYFGQVSWWVGWSCRTQVAVAEDKRHAQCGYFD